MNKIVIYPPGHHNGHKTYWMWAICSDKEEIDCGSAKDAQEAWEDGLHRFEDEQQNNNV